MKMPVHFSISVAASILLVLTLALPVQSVVTTEQQKLDANKIIEYFKKGPGKGRSYNWLARFTDLHPSRHTPTKGYDDAADDLWNQLKNAGFDRLYAEEAGGIPDWHRIDDPDKPDQAIMTKPRRYVIPVLPLGNSSAASIKSARVVVVRSFDELNALPDSRVKGAIVVYNQPWVFKPNPLDSYLDSGPYRFYGVDRAAKRGAAAALVRSLASLSLYTPHTGAIFLDKNASATHIGAGAITVEDAELLWRLQEAGHEIEMSLEINTVYYGEIVKKNFIVEITGSTKPDELVVFGGHMDSWDTGTGALDDGAGIAATLHAILAFKALGLRPKRTLRAVFWTSEELGYMGSNAYFAAHKNESEKMSLAMECDTGTFAPIGYHFAGNAEAQRRLQDVLNLMAPINATLLANDGYVAGEQENFYEIGVPTVELYSANDKYFWYHHTYADTMTLMNSDEMDGCAALFAATAYVVADLDELLPHGK